MTSTHPHGQIRAEAPSVATPTKPPLNQLYDADKQPSSCTYGSPISGVCMSAPAQFTAADTVKCRLDMASASHAQPKPLQPGSTAPARRSSAWPVEQQINMPTAMTSSMPDLWPAGARSGSSTPRQQTAGQHGGPRQQLQLRLSADNTPRRDQDLTLHAGATSSRSSQQGVARQHQGMHTGAVAGAGGVQPVEQQLLLPLEVLLSPLLPSADEAKLVDRLSQLRHALDQHVRLAAGWEQQAITLQQTLSEAQEEALVLRGQVASQQHHISLLGGNLQGRLSLVQGAVLARMQEQISDKDNALAASTQQLLLIQGELEKLSCSYAAKLGAEQAERQRLMAEAAQARLLCTARARQVSTLQQELQQLRDAASQQQQTSAAASSLQQQQLEDLRQRLQQAQQQVVAAQQEAAEAQHAAAAAEGGTEGLRQQVEELQGLLAERQLQIEWLEGRIADVEGSDINQQLKRHRSEVMRLQEAAAADRRALEQQLGSAQRQLAKLQQQDQAWQHQVNQLEQQVQHLQQQLVQHHTANEELQSHLQQQVQRADGVEAAAAERLAAAESDLQELQAQLAAAQQEANALRQLQEQQQMQEELQLSRQDSIAEAATAGADALSAGGAAAGARSPQVPSAVVHALRAELGMANAEVARLRHQLDVLQTSQQQERELTGHEILRLQQELSEAAVSGSAGAAAAAPAGDSAAEEVTSCIRMQQVGSDSSSSWHSVHDNPAYETLQLSRQQGAGSGAATAAAQDVLATASPAVLLQPLPAQQLAVLPTVHEADCGDNGSAAGKLSRYEAKVQDQADTISSLQRQLKQQEQLLAALQKRDRRVFDSAASKNSWAEALGFDDHPPGPTEPSGSAAAGAPTASVSEPTTPHADAAVQTDLSGPAESAGSTAAAPAAAASEDNASTAAPGTRDQQASSRQGTPPAAATAADNTGSDGNAESSSALLAAARHEILRLQELNRQLVHAHAEALKASVSYDDASRAVSEAKQHAKAKAAAMLQASNKAWSDRLAAACTHHQELQSQLQDAQQQRDQLAEQLTAASQTHHAAALQMQQELAAAQQQCQTLQQQLQHMADSHQQELEQVRMEVEADAAAAMLDAAAASNQLEHQQQQLSKQQQSRVQGSDAAVQTECTATVREAAAQTDTQLEQPWQLVSSAANTATALQDGAQQEHQQQRQQPSRHVGGNMHQLHVQHLQQQQQQQQGTAVHGGPSPVHRPVQQWVAEQQSVAPPLQQPPGASSAAVAERPCTPQPAAACPVTNLHTAADAMTEQAPAAPQEPAGQPQPAAASLQQQQQHTVAAWDAAGAGGGTDVTDDDICRFSSASDTPASASSRGPMSRVRSSAAPGAAAGTDMLRPGSAGALSLPELTTSSSPIAPSSAAPAAHQPLLGTRHQQQQPYSPPAQQLARVLQEQQQPQQQQQQPQQQQEQQQRGSQQMQGWHAELLQQQVELEALRARLSQQQQQQQPWRTAGGTSSRGSPAVANTRALLMAPFGPSTGAAAAAAAAAVSSPGGPLLSSSSPMTYQQRRAAALQGAAPAGVAHTTSSRLSAATQQLHSQQSLMTAAEQQQQGPGSGPYAQYPRWRRSSSPDGLQQQPPVTTSTAGAGSGNALASSPSFAAGIAALDAGAAPGVTGSSSSAWGQSLMAAAASKPARRALSPPAARLATAAGLAAPADSIGGRAVAVGGSSSSSAAPAGGGAVAAAAGLAQLGDDVLDALSLSRYHRERSKMQEARAKQHALLASHHEGQAAALRSSRLTGVATSGAAAAASATAPAAGVSSWRGVSGAVSGGAAGPRLWQGGGGGTGSSNL